MNTDEAVATTETVATAWIDWRNSGWVAVARGFPDTTNMAHRPVKTYRDERLTSMNVADREVLVSPACQEPNPDDPHYELSPRFAEWRGAEWCRDPACYRGDDDA